VACRWKYLRVRCLRCWAKPLWRLIVRSRPIRHRGCDTGQQSCSGSGESRHSCRSRSERFLPWLNECTATTKRIACKLAGALPMFLLATQLGHLDQVAWETPATALLPASHCVYPAGHLGRAETGDERPYKFGQDSTPFEPPELRAPTFDFTLWLKYPFSECPRPE
jgi:hypothetical protein